MKIIGLVPVRKGSKRFPGKNLAMFEGEPLFGRAIRQSERLFMMTAFSTDYDLRALWEEHPLHLALSFHVVHRPPQLAEDDTPTYAVVIHAALMLGLDRDDWVCLLQPTCPLRTDGEIMRVVARALGAGDGCYSTNYDTSKMPDHLSVPPERPPNGSVYFLRVGTWAKLERHDIEQIATPLYLGREEIDINTPEDLKRAEDKMRMEDKLDKLVDLVRRS